MRKDGPRRSRTRTASTTANEDCTGQTRTFLEEREWSVFQAGDVHFGRHRKWDLFNFVDLIAVRKLPYGRREILWIQATDYTNMSKRRHKAEEFEGLSMLPGDVLVFGWREGQWTIDHLSETDPVAWRRFSTRPPSCVRRRT